MATTQTVIHDAYEGAYYNCMGAMDALRDSVERTYPKPDIRGTFTRAQIDALQDIANRVEALLVGFE